MGLFDSLQDVLGLEVSGAQIPSAQRSFKQSRFLQFLSLGGDPESLRVTKAQFKALGKDSRLKRGKRGEFFRAPDAEILIAQATRFADRQVDAKADFRKSLEKIPEFASLIGEAGGRSDVADAAFRSLGQEVLGAAAPRGFLFDQAPGLLSAVALSKAQFQQGVQDRARGSVLNSLGLAQPSGFDPTFLTQALSGNQALQFQFGADIQGATAFNDILGLNAGIRTKLFSDVVNAGESVVGGFFGGSVQGGRGGGEFATGGDQGSP